MEAQIAAFKAYCDTYWDLLPVAELQPYLLEADVRLFKRDWFYTGCVSLKTYLYRDPKLHAQETWAEYTSWLRAKLHEDARKYRGDIYRKCREYYSK